MARGGRREFRAQLRVRGGQLRHPFAQQMEVEHGSAHQQGVTPSLVICVRFR